MPLVPVPEGRAIWQQVAEAYRPPNDPFSLYSQDEQQGVLHAATLAINFELFVNALPMHNAWSAGHWFGPYPLRIVDEERWRCSRAWSRPRRRRRSSATPSHPPSAP